MGLQIRRKTKIANRMIRTRKDLHFWLKEDAKKKGDNKQDFV